MKNSSLQGALQQVDLRRGSKICLSKMKVLLVVFAAVLVCQISAKSIGDTPEKAGESPYNEELVVASSLNIKKKAPELKREKRQFGGFGGPQQNYGQSSSLANANAYNQYGGPGGFGGSAANAGAQGFQSQGPLGGFGASAANTQTQAFNAGPNGIQGSAGLAGSQTYNLPGGHHIDLAYGGSYGANNGQGAGSNSHSLTYT